MGNPLYLRCAAAGIIGGVVLVGYSELNMFWQGVALIVVGCLALGGWIWSLSRPGVTPPPKPSPAGPTFDPDDPEVTEIATVTTNLVDRVRRERQGRSGD